MQKFSLLRGFLVLWLMHSFFFSPIAAQIVPNESFIGLQYRGLQQQGVARYLLFHNTTATNLAYHQHYIYDPFTEAIEQAKQLELQAQYYLNVRTIVQVQLPYQINQRYLSDTLQMKKQGVGDVKVLGKYVVYSSTLFSLNEKVKHLLILGGGVKLPSGAYTTFIDNEIEPHAQVGSGSTDFLGTALYNLSYNKIGGLLQANYAYKQTNKFTYKYGNTLNVEMLLSYRMLLAKKYEAIPMLKLGYTNSLSDSMNETAVPENTGGQWYWTHLGAALTAERWQLQVMYGLPIVAKPIGTQLKYTGFVQINTFYLMKKSNH